MATDEQLEELKKKVKEKEEAEDIYRQKKKLQEKLEEGSLKGIAKKGIKKLWGGL